jgi:hypothetical protein
VADPSPPGLLLAWGLRGLVRGSAVWDHALAEYEGDRATWVMRVLLGWRWVYTDALGTELVYEARAEMWLRLLESRYPGCVEHVRPRA